MNRGRILVVDDDQFYQEFCREILEEEGYVVKSTYTGEEALELIKREPFDIMLVDLIMDGMGGLEVLEQTKRINSEIDVIIMTGYASVDSAVKCLKAGAVDYLTKPLNPEVVKLTVKRAIELRHLFDENFELRNLLTLYESCQRVSQVLELDSLYGTSLDAVLQALQGDLGLIFFHENNRWRVKAARGMDEDDARSIMNQMLENELKEREERVLSLDKPSVAAEDGAGRHLRINSAMALPILVPNALEGTIVSFRKDGNHVYDRMDLSTARFISEQIHLSFENAISYNDAQRLVFVDDLTGLYNTRYLDMALQTELKRAQRFKYKLSLLFIDIDYFKNVNDTHGHLVGSEVLIQTGNVIRECIREIDVAVRYGGDEFLAILVETGSKGAMTVAERIRKSMEDRVFKINGLELNLTCCVGIATYPDDAETRTELINLADKAMYRGKETGRNVVYAASTL